MRICLKTDKNYTTIDNSYTLLFIYFMPTSVLIIYIYYLFFSITTFVEVRTVISKWCKWNCSVVSDSAVPWIVVTRLLHPWNFPDKSTGVGCRFHLQGIFLTQGSNPGLPHCRQTPYHLSHQGSLVHQSKLTKVMEIIMKKIQWHQLVILQTNISR